MHSSANSGVLFCEQELWAPKECCDITNDQLGVLDETVAPAPGRTTEQSTNPPSPAIIPIIYLTHKEGCGPERSVVALQGGSQTPPSRRVQGPDRQRSGGLVPLNTQCQSSGHPLTSL